jgi:signal transduction histidine kinase
MAGRGAITVSASVGLMDADPAIQHRPAPTRIVVIDVLDDGPGIPADLTDHIFNPFFTTKPEGSGLGLAIVRKIVDAHDGRIDVGTRPALAGTRFRITLPVDRAGGPLR